MDVVTGQDRTGPDNHDNTVSEGHVSRLQFKKKKKESRTGGVGGEGNFPLPGGLPRQLRYGQLQSKLRTATVYSYSFFFFNSWDHDEMRRSDKYTVGQRDSNRRICRLDFLFRFVYSLGTTTEPSTAKYKAHEYMM